MDLNLYRVFIHVYESDSLMQAAERLHISQSAVSHGLSRLRSHFDDELFTKEGRKLVATAYARRLYPEVRQAVNALQVASEQRNISTLIAQTKQLTIAMNNEIELVLLPDIHDAFAKVASQLNINSVRLERSSMNKQLKLGKIDIAIDVSRSVSDLIYQKPLLNDTFVVLSNQHFSEELTLDRYLQAQHILVSSRPKGKSVEDIQLVQLGYHRHIAMRCQRYDSAVRVLQHTEKPYLLTLPALLAKSLHTEGLSIVDMPTNLPPLSLDMFWHKDMHKDVWNVWVRNQLDNCVRINKTPIN